MSENSTQKKVAEGMAQIGVPDSADVEDSRSFDFGEMVRELMDIPTNTVVVRPMSGLETQGLQKFFRGRNRENLAHRLETGDVVTIECDDPEQVDRISAHMGESLGIGDVYWEKSSTP